MQADFLQLLDWRSHSSRGLAGYLCPSCNSQTESRGHPSPNLPPIKGLIHWLTQDQLLCRWLWVAKDKQACDTQPQASFWSVLVRERLCRGWLTFWRRAGTGWDILPTVLLTWNSGEACLWWSGSTFSSPRSHPAIAKVTTEVDILHTLTTFRG